MSTSDTDDEFDATLATAELTHTDEESGPAQAHGAPNLEPGNTLGRYVIVHQLGEGAMGVVAAAYDPELDRKVAIKVLHGNRSGSERGRQRLMREAQALARVTHPNIVTVHDVGIHEGRVFLAMEFIDGHTATQWGAAKDRTWQEVVAVFLQAGRGLVAAHRKSLIHRDFKPDNVMIDAEGRVRVMDFGLARASDAEMDAELDAEAFVHPAGEGDSTTVSNSLSTPLTRTGAVLGTPVYMSPERMLGLVATEASDQFAFCVALYEMLYGDRPFAGETLGALAFNVSQGGIADPPRGTRVPTWVRRVVLRGLAVKPEQRWPDMATLLSKLRDNPGRRRRRWAMAGGVVAAIGVGLGTPAWLEHRARGACDAEAEAVGDLWSTERIARIDAAFRETTSPMAEATWNRSRPALDAYVSTLIDAQRTTCLDATVDETLSADLRARATECVEERSARLDGLLGALETVDDQAVSRVQTAVSALPLARACTDPKTLAARVPAPSSQATREAVEDLRRRMWLENGRSWVGRHEAALTTVRKLRPDVEATGWAPLLAEYLLLEGALAEVGGDIETAVQRQTEAFYLAGSVGHDTVAIDAAIAMVLPLSKSNVDVEEARMWARHAQMWLDRADFAPDALERAQLLNNLGMLERDVDNFDEAIARHQEALAIRESVLGAEHPRTTQSMNNLANVYFRVDRFEEAAGLHERALAIRQAVYGEQHPLVATSLRNLGIMKKSLGDVEGALGLAERALAIRRTTLGADHPLVASALNGRAELLATLDRPDAAVADYEEALRIWQKAYGDDHPKVAAALNNLAFVELDQGDAATAIERFRRVVEITVKRRGPDHLDTAMYRQNLGRALTAASEYEEAIELLRLAVDRRVEKLGEEHRLSQSTLGHLEAAYTAAGRTEEAAQTRARIVPVEGSDG